MWSFSKLRDLLNEELLRQINLMNAIKRSGIPPQVFNSAKAVMSINDFLANPPSEARGAYALGLTKSTGDVYNQIAKAFNMVSWQDAYKQTFGSGWWRQTQEPDITHRFMSNFAKDSGRRIVFFLPNDATTNREGARYTREEIEYLMQHPEQMAKVIFVLGTYDVMDPKDYDNLVANDEEGWPRDLPDQEKLMQNVLRNPQQHGKPGQPY